MRLKKDFWVLILMVLFFSHKGYSQLDDCSMYRTGKFIVPSAEFGDTYIKRSKKFQIEKGVDARSGKKFKLKDKIIWIDSCTYKLVSLKVKDENGIAGTETLVFSIIEAGKDYYIVRLSEGLDGFEIDVRVNVK